MDSRTRPHRASLSSVHESIGTRSSRDSERGTHAHPLRVSFSPINPSTGTRNSRDREGSARPDPPRFSLSSIDESTTVRSIRDPDGGKLAWLVALGGFCNFITAFGFMNAYGMMQEFYTSTSLIDPPLLINLIGSVQVFLMFVGGIVVGPSFDKFGARRIMIPGAAIVLLSYVLTSFSIAYWQVLLSQGFLFGIRNAMLYYPATSAISEWFDRKRALALGIAVSGSSIGAIAWTFVLNTLLNTAGFAWTHRVLAIASFPLLALACFLVKERPGSRGVDPHGNEVQTPPRSLKKELTDKNFVLLCAALCFIYSGMLIPFTYIPLYGLYCGFEKTVASNFLMACYSGSVAGRVATGWIADRYGR
ncbi:Fc.00g101480.m01.CDS01 [Cosmosporella sp. VM-42]